MNTVDRQLQEYREAVLRARAGWSCPRADGPDGPHVHKGIIWCQSCTEGSQAGSIGDPIRTGART